MEILVIMSNPLILHVRMLTEAQGIKGPVPGLNITDVWRGCVWWQQRTAPRGTSRWSSGLHASNLGGVEFDPWSRELRSHMPRGASKQTYKQKELILEPG